MIKKVFLLFVLITLGIVTISAQKLFPIYLDESKSIDERVANALSLMTVDEKVALCHAQSKFSVKGVARLGIPELWMSDGPHGVRAEFEWNTWQYAGWTNDSCTAFPALTCLAATFNPSLSYIYGKAIGEEARYRKKDVLLGPGVNIYRTPLNGRNFEYLGEDPYLASKMSVPYIWGVQESGVAACLKHFALNNQEKWRSHIDVEVSDRALYEIYLPAFKSAVIEGKVESIMGSYNKFRGQHCCHNELLLNKILKTDWQFDGVVISDWGGTHDSFEAVNYGLDIEMGTHTNGLTSDTNSPYNTFYLADPFLEGIKSGKYSMKLLDDKATRVLKLLFRTALQSKRPLGSLATAEHAAVSRKIAEEGIVLLKNSTDILPLKTNSLKNILVVGENATRMMTKGGGSSELKVKLEVSPLQGLKNAMGADVKITYAMGYASGPSMYGKVVPPKFNTDSLRKAAVELAKQADVVIYVGGLNKNYLQDCEDGDRLQLELPFDQNLLLNQLAEVNPKVVVVLLSGNAVAMPWLNKVPAVVQAWYLGSEAGNAIASVLTGTVNPSGKLPFTFPVKLSDCGAHSFGELSYPGDSIKQVYSDDILVGYRWYDTKKITPLFPFGYGLSYTSFKLGKATIQKSSFTLADTAIVTVPLANIGLLNGKEVIQIYVTDSKASVQRPLKELKGFAKMNLKAGESKTVEIKLPVADWAFYDEKIGNWNLEAGKFILSIGTSSRDISQKIEVAVK